jgi:cell division protein FtsQ
MTRKNLYNRKINTKISLYRKIRWWSDYFFIMLKLSVLIFIALFFCTGYFSDFKKKLQNEFSEIFSDVGFSLESVIIRGNKNIPNDIIISSLNADVGTPLFFISLSKIYNKLHENSWVKNIYVMRKWPNTIVIDIEEKIPFAIWQNEKKLFLIDTDGNILESGRVEKFPDLLRVIGSDANIHAEQLVHILQSQKELMSKVLFAVRYGERRWNLILDQQITVKFPEQNIEKAWSYVSKMFEKGILFDNNYKSIDLRDHNKYYIEKFDSNIK